MSWNVTVLMKGHTPCLFSSLFKQNRVFDWQLQHLGREFELNFVPGRGGNLKELILKSSNAGEREGGGGIAVWGMLKFTIDQ